VEHKTGARYNHLNLCPIEEGPTKTSMNKAISLALLIAGAILLAFGIDASNSAGSSISRAVNGAPTNEAIWLLVGGGIAALVGLVGVLRGSRET
jgi:hypothetical protein